MQRLGIRMRQRRLDSGRTGADLAREAGWTLTYWRNLEDGARQSPGPESIVMVSRALGTVPSMGLFSDLSMEQLWWGLTSQKTIDVACRIIKALEPTTEFLQDQRQWQWLIDRNYPSASDDPGRRVHTPAPDIDRRRPETWPRPLLVDVLCYRVQAARFTSTDFRKDSPPEIDPFFISNLRPGITVWTAVSDSGDPLHLDLLEVPIEMEW